MSGYAYGVIEVTQGADAANATPRSQVAAMIADAISPTKIYGGIQKTNGNVTAAVADGVWTNLPGTFVALASSGITNTGAALTYTASASHNMAVTLVVTLSQDDISPDMLLTFFLNGNQYSWASNDVITELATLNGTKYQLILTTIVPLSNGDVLVPKITLTGTTMSAGANVTNYAMQFFITQAD